MKRTTILLEEDLLLEIQQLARQYQMTTSQVIQRALAQYVENERQARLHPPARTRDELAALTSSRRASGPFRYVRQTPPTSEQSGDPPTQAVEEAAGDGKQASGRVLLPLVLGALSALFALYELVQTIERFRSQAPILEAVINFLIPAILLGAVAAAFFFVAAQNRRSRGI